MNKKWWFGVLTLLILVVGLSIVSVNAEGGSDEVVTQEESGGYEVLTHEEAYESLRQHGVNEEIIQGLIELNSKFNDGISHEEAEALANELNQRSQQLERDDKGTKSSGNP